MKLQPYLIANPHGPLGTLTPTAPLGFQQITVFRDPITFGLIFSPLMTPIPSTNKPALENLTANRHQLAMVGGLDSKLVSVPVISP